MVRVITSVNLFCEMRGKGNESFCFLRLHNFPSEVLIKQSDANLDFCDHFLQLILATITLVTDAGGPVGETVFLIHHHLHKQLLISGEQSGDL